MTVLVQSIYQCVIKTWLLAEKLKIEPASLTKILIVVHRQVFWEV